MKYYKGACKNDIPKFGGSFVDQYGYGHEEFNFLPIEMEGVEELQCMGFVEPKSHKSTRNTFHIEKLEGCAAMKNEPCIDDVLVIWCAKHDVYGITVVGWYKNATIWRELQGWTMCYPNGQEEERVYNISAKASDCTLLPKGLRTENKWSIPTAQYTKTFGFGQSMVWYPVEPQAKPFLERLVSSIEKYNGENWLEVYPE